VARLRRGQRRGKSRLYGKADLTAVDYPESTESNGCEPKNYLRAKGRAAVPLTLLPGIPNH